MRTRNRTRDEVPAPAGATGGAGAGDGAQRWREADRLAREADAILERALAGDSQRFLDANQQRGGE
jgi:hypothetical protein